MAKITAADHGTWLDGAHGWTNGYRCIERAVSYGWKIPEEYADGWAAFEAKYGDSDLWADANGDDGGFVDAATDYLQEIAPEGYVFRWDAGELSMIPAWMDCMADGGGCEVTEYGPDGSESRVSPCMDHKPDHKIRIGPSVLSDEFSTYTVMLWDETDEILSGSVDVTFTPVPEWDEIDRGEFWFPEILRNPRLREAAEKLLTATRCEGHVDTDDALTSGVGIGESVRCDGSCQG